MVEKENKELLVGKINRLKKERNAVILAHNYQRKEIQEVADYVDDSLALSRKAAETDAEVIVFCGVHFMAESAAILSPQKKVILPEEKAGCPMADMVTAEGLRALKEKHPGAAVVTYINSSAAVKAETDVCCTSANAVKIVQSLTEKKIIFAPDRNLGTYVQSQLPDKEVILWAGYCPTHEQIGVEDVLELKREHPQAVVLVHPECRKDVIALADYVHSTTGIIKAAGEMAAQEFIVCTEYDLIHRMEKEAPGKKIYFPVKKPLCPNMKLTTLKKLAAALENMAPEITVPEEISRKARLALDRMLELS